MKNLLFAGFLAALIPNLMEAGGTWTSLASGPPVGVNNCMLMSDGTVLGMNGAGQCVKLTPDIHGSYVNGTWTTLATMNNSRLFFSSQLLTNGNLWVAGGEDGSGGSSAELYNPLNNIWTLIPPPSSGYPDFSDSISEILPNGNPFVCPVYTSTSCLIYNVASNTWQTAASCAASQDEADWVKLPSDNIVTIDAFSQNSEHYIPSLNEWVADGGVPVQMFDFSLGELGSGHLLPNGQVFYIGSTTNTAIYTPGGSVTSAGTWLAGTNMPNDLGASDAPAAMLVNGKILCCLGPSATYNGPCSFYEYDYTVNTFTQVNAPGGGSTYGGSAPFGTSMLDLPDGTVLFVGGQNSGSLYVYTPDGIPLAAGQPVINSITENTDGSYSLTGTGLNGISEGAGYGDDEQMSGNYPLVRLTNNVSGNVYYARTFNWNSTSVQTGSRVVATEFALPQNLPAGTYSLVVTAVGNPSVQTNFIYAPPPVPTGLTAASGSNALVNLQWNASVGATSYNIKRALSNSGYFATVATVGGTNYTDSGLVNGLTYYYKVAAVGSGGPSSDSTAVSATPNGPPPAPTGLTAVPDTFERIDLAWFASYGATNYNIKRSSTHNGPYTNVASSANPAYTDTGLASGTTNYYVVSAVSSGGESSNSIEASAVAQAIANFGFETPSLGSGNYQYALPGGGWTFNGSPGNGSGILGNGSGFSNPNAPEGVQAAFLQGHGVISQVLSGFAPGTNYTITYSAAQRPGNSQSWNVMIDSAVIKSNSPGGTSYTTYTASFVATAVTHTLLFVGTDLAGGDNTVFLDNVRINPPLATTVALPVLTQDTLPATAATVVGDSVTFTAAFAATPAANYQWQFIGNGMITNLVGATNATLTLTNLQLAGNGFYRLEAVNATNSLGVIYSSMSPLAVSNVPGPVNNVVTSYAAQTGYGSVRTNFMPTWTVAPNSVIAGQSPSSVGSGSFSMNGTGGTGVFTDGTYGYLNYWPGTGSSPTEATCGSSAGQSVTYTLTGSASGYILTNIVVYGGWGDAGRDQQAYTVYYSTVSAPTTFNQLSIVNYLPVNAAAVQCATRASLTPATGVLASNVAAVKFDFTTPAGENGYEGYSEIDLYGTSQSLIVLTNTLPVTAADVVGSQVTFSASFGGLNPIGYQWQKISGGVTNNIFGATNTTLALASLQLTNTAAYQLQASNAYGIAVSTPGLLTVSNVPAAVNNVITELAVQTGFGPSDTLGTSFTPTWTVMTNNSLIAGQPPSSTVGNFSLEQPGRSFNSLTAGGSETITLISGTSGYTTSTNYVTCGNGGGAGASLIYTLTGSASGFNLTNILVYGGWGDAGRDQQACTVYYSTVAAPATFIELSSVNYLPMNTANVECATRATLVPANGVLATNVAAVKFDFTSPASENGYCGYAQIQLFGLPTPQPVKWAVGSGNWDTTTLNWMLLSGGGATHYIENNLAAFDDSAAGSSPITVTLTGDRSPSIVTNNSTKTYIIAGAYSVTNGSLVKNGSGTLVLDDGGANWFSGMQINNGMLQVGNGDAGGSLGPGNVTNNATLAFNRSDTLAISNLISGSGSLVQNGSGTLVLSSADTYAGNTFVNAGKLALVDPGSITASTLIAIADGAALDVTGRADQTLTLNAGQTLKGSGSVNGNLMAQTGSTVNPGDTIGTFTVQGNVVLNGLLLMEINRTNSPVADELAATTGTIAAEGTLTVTNVGPSFQAGDTFQLFNKPLTGSTMVGLPLVGPGLAWANNLTNNGTLTVVSTLSPTLVAQMNGGLLTFFWPLDHTGWRLQIQTNDLPQGLGTNWMDVAGSTVTNQLAMPINPTDGSVFYRLFYQ